MRRGILATVLAALALGALPAAVVAQRGGEPAAAATAILAEQILIVRVLGASGLDRDTTAQIHAVVDQATKPTDLADLVIANFPVPVADKVSYAEETEPSRKLDRAIALLRSELAKAPAPPP